MKMKAYIVQLCLLLALTPSFAQFGDPTIPNSNLAEKLSDNTALTDANFDQTLYENNDKPWFIKFYAPWCHHCQVLAPIWSQMASQNKDVHFGEVDCVAYYGLCSRFGVQGFPTLLFAEDMKTLYTFPVMMRTEDTLKEFIENTMKYHNTSDSQPFPVNSAFVPPAPKAQESSIINETSETSGNASINNTTPLPPTSPEQPIETGISEAHDPNFLPAGKENERISQDSIVETPEAWRQDLDKWGVTDADLTRTQPNQQPYTSIPLTNNEFPQTNSSFNQSNTTFPQTNQLNNSFDQANTTGFNQTANTSVPETTNTTSYDLNTQNNFSNPISNPDLFNTSNTTEQTQFQRLPSDTQIPNAPYNPNAGQPIEPQYPHDDPRNPERFQRAQQPPLPGSPTDQYMFANSAGVPATDNINHPDFRADLNPNVPNRDTAHTLPNNAAANRPGWNPQRPQDLPGYGQRNINNANLNTFNNTPATTFNNTESTFNNTSAEFNNTPSTFNDTSSTAFNNTASTFNNTPSTFNNTASTFNNTASTFNNTPTGLDNITQGLNDTFNNATQELGNVWDNVNQRWNNTQQWNNSTPGWNYSAQNNSEDTYTKASSVQAFATPNDTQIPAWNNTNASALNNTNASALNNTNASALNNTENNTQLNMVGPQNTWNQQENETTQFNNSFAKAQFQTPELTNFTAGAPQTANFSGLPNATANQSANLTANTTFNQTGLNTTNSTIANETTEDKGFFEQAYDATIGSVVDSVEGLFVDTVTDKASEVANSTIDSLAEKIPANVSSEFKDTAKDFAGSAIKDYAANGTVNSTLDNAGNQILDKASNITNTNLSNLSSTASNVYDSVKNANTSNISDIANQAINSLPEGTVQQAGDMINNYTGSNVTGLASNLTNTTGINTSNLSNTATDIYNTAKSNISDIASNFTNTNNTNLSDIANTASNVYDTVKNTNATDIKGIANEAINALPNDTVNQAGDLLNNYTGSNITQTAQNWTGSNLTGTASSIASNFTNTTGLNTSDLSNTASQVYDNLTNTASSYLNDSNLTQTAANFTGVNTSNESVWDTASNVADKAVESFPSAVYTNTTVDTTVDTTVNTSVNTTAAKTTPVEPESGEPKVPIDTSNSIPTNSTSPMISDSPVTGINTTVETQEVSSHPGEVIKLTDGDFDEILANYPSKNPWFIKFYAPWCPHCQRLAPTWVDLAKELKDEVNVADVDCVENYALRQRFNINGYPTLVMIVDDSMYLYRGDRSLEALKSFALNTKQFKNTTVATAMPPKDTNVSVNWGTESGRYNWLILPVVILSGVAITMAFIWLVYALIVRFATRSTVDPIQFAELNGETVEMGESPEHADNKIGDLEDDHSKINIDTTRDTEGILTERAAREQQIRNKAKFGGAYDIEAGDLNLKA